MQCFHAKPGRFVLYPFVYTNIMKMHLKMETSENEDLSGDLENGAGKMYENARVNKLVVNSKNEYLVNTEAIGS